jgi:alpha-beta hydrolase superfamily lysophospholipase
MFLATNGYRTIGHDRRGHGRSDQPWTTRKGKRALIVKEPVVTMELA